jgi:hypothetical protein
MPTRVGKISLKCAILLRHFAALFYPATWVTLVFAQGKCAILFKRREQHFVLYSLSPPSLSCPLLLVYIRPPDNCLSIFWMSRNGIEYRDKESSHTFIPPHTSTFLRGFFFFWKTRLKTTFVQSS